MSTATITAIITLLSPLVSGRFHPDGEAPQSPKPPYMIWNDVTSSVSNTLSEGINIDQMRMQIDVFARRKMDLLVLVDQIRAAMEAAAISEAIPNICLTAQGMFEPEVKLQREILEFSIWT